jgi:hypothetical protein
VVTLAVAHAPWAPGRKESLARMLSGIKHGEANVFASPARERAEVWAMRIWRWAAERGGPVLVLNDDVSVHPWLTEVVGAMLTARPGRFLSLHTNAPAAPALAQAGERWIASYWLTGPAYVLPDGAAARLVEWCDRNRATVWAGNEDSAGIEWMWSEQKPALLSIPALVQHDVAVPSTLGYDKHPMRVSQVPWSDHDEKELEAMTNVDYWAGDRELSIECPWLSESQLRHRANLRTLTVGTRRVRAMGDP